jgi:hypothetical protein
MDPPRRRPHPTTTILRRQPTLKFTLNRYSGKSPVTIAFDLCESTDSSGGKNLTYLADFDEGQGLTDQGSCQFQHRYRSGGVTVFDAKVAVRGVGGQQAQEVLRIKTYVDVSISVAPTACNKISATADRFQQLHRRARDGGRSRQFEAFDAGGRLEEERASRAPPGGYPATVTPSPPSCASPRPCSPRAWPATTSRSSPAPVVNRAAPR